MPSNPEFVIYTGPMFGGKTSRMLAALDRAKYQSKNIAAFKPKMDHRYADESIVTHTGHSCEAICISDGSEIFDYTKKADIIAVDEAFMIDGVANALDQLGQRRLKFVLQCVRSAKMMLFTRWLRFLA
jgi:thymidine kinase